MRELYFFRKIDRKTFHPRCGFAEEQIIFQQRCHPLWGFLKTYKNTFILPKEALAGNAAESFWELGQVM